MIAFYYFLCQGVYYTKIGVGYALSIQAKGIYSEGNVTAQGDIIGTVTVGTASQSYGVRVNSDASMVAKNIYYCNEIRGEVQGNKIQKCL